MRLRPYQADLIHLTLDAFRGSDRCMIEAATGAGKTVIFCELAKLVPAPKKVLVLAHRHELVGQAAEKLEAMTGIAPAIESGKSQAPMDARFVVSTVQAMNRRKVRFSRDHFRLVVADECHHATSNQWKAVLEYWTDAKLFGVTATPTPEAEEFFQIVAGRITLTELVRQGYLAPIKVRTLPVSVDWRGLSVRKGDFDQNAAAEMIQPALTAVAEGIRDFASNRRTIVFLPLVKTSVQFVEILESIGVKAAHIDGNSENRPEILNRFRAGEFQVLSNSSLLLEGFDDPGVSCVVVLRPTKSPILYRQAIGRGTRIHLGKQDLLILDPLVLSSDFSLQRPIHLLGCDDTPEDLNAVSEAMSGLEAPLDDIAAQLEAQRAMSLSKRLRQWAESQGYEFDPLEWTPTRPADLEPPTAKQLETLKKFKVDPSTIQCRGHASKIIEAVIEARENRPASWKQIRRLRMEGCQVADDLTAREARRLFSQINHRRRKPA